MTDTVRAPAAATAQGPRTSDRLGGTINPKHTDTAPPNQEFAGLPRRAVRRHRGGRPMSATCLACGSPFKPQRSTARDALLEFLAGDGFERSGIVSPDQLPSRVN